MIYFGLILLLILNFIFNLKHIKIESDVLQKKVTVQLRGFYALFIFLGHLAYNLIDKTYARILLWFLYLFVGFYFFLTGYSLRKSFFEKENYLNNFWYKRLKIIIPYFECCIIYGIVYFLCYSEFNLKQFCLDTFFLQKLGAYWFVISIFIIYCIFYISFLQKKINSDLIFIILNIIYMICLIFLKSSSHFYISIFSCSVGLLYHKYEKKILSYLSIKRSIIFSIIFVFLFFVDKYLSYKEINYVVINLILKNSLCTLFCMLNICLLKNFLLESKFLTLIGNISYYIYLVHPLLLVFINTKYSSNNLIFGVIFISVILFSYMLSSFNNKIIYRKLYNKINYS